MKNSKTLLIQLFIIIIIIFTNFCSKDNCVKNMGIFAPDRLNKIIGQDGCSPIKLNDKLLMWTFGDTILGSWKKKITVNSTFEESAIMDTMLDNSLAFTVIPDDKTINKLQFKYYRKNKKIKPFIKLSAGKNTSQWRYWAIDGIQLSDKIYIYYMKVKIDKNIKPYPFRVTGTGIGSWAIPANWEIGDTVNFKKIDTIFFEGEPTFGDSIIKHKNYLYLIGHLKIEKENNVYAYFARVHEKNITKRSKYEYLNKNGLWVKKFNRSNKFFSEIAGEPSLSYNNYLNKFIIVFCTLNGNIKLCTFNNFKQLSKNYNIKTIYTPEKLITIPNRPELFYYSGKEIFYTKNYVYAIYINPAIYQPILLKIPYTLIK